MSYFTLDEAADWLTRRLGGAEVLGSPVTAAQMLRYGIHGHLPLCIALDVRCYSPTTKARNETAARIADPDGWFRHDVSGQAAMEAATVDVVGFFVVPLRTLFAFEARDEVMVEFVTSLDGANSYKPFERITRTRLRVMVKHLTDFATGIQLVVDHPEGTKKVWTEAEKLAIRKALEAGETQTAVGRRLGVTRQRIAEIAGVSARPTPSANNPFSLSKTKRSK
jgi:hypothetical protein